MQQRHFWAESFVESAKFTVVVEDGDFHDGSPAEPDVLAVPAGDERQFQEELLVGLPLVVVHDLDADLDGDKLVHFYWKDLSFSLSLSCLFLSLMRLKEEDLVDRFVVFTLNGRSVNGFDPANERERERFESFHHLKLSPSVGPDFDGLVHSPVPDDGHLVRADALQHGSRG